MRNDESKANRVKPDKDGARSQDEPIRNRAAYALTLLCVIIAGISIRKIVPGLPPLFMKIAGDALWALAVFLFFALLLPRRSTRDIGIAAALFSIGIEFSQLCQAHWLNGLRRTLPGRLILGSVFAWADFSYYALGITAGILFESALRSKQASGNRH